MRTFQLIERGRHLPSWRLCHLALSVCVLVAGPLSAQQRTAPATNPERARVMAVIDSAMAAINAGNMVALSALMTDSAQIYATAPVKGKAGYFMSTAIAERAAGTRPPILERGFEADVRIAGGMAVVWMPYDLWMNGKWSHCGVDLFTLVQVDAAWRIANLTYTIEQPPACRVNPAGTPAGYQPPPIRRE